MTTLDSRVNKLPSGERMIGNLAQIDPLSEPRWAGFVQKHPHGSTFHSTAWLEALRRTYGCRPAALATSDSNGHLVNALVFCRVCSWVTGRRIVSLPFSDHCAPLVEDEETLAYLVSALVNVAQAEKCRYVELRPESQVLGTLAELQNSQNFYLHRLDLRSGESEVFNGFHPSSIQRKIRRAKRERLSVQEGRTPEILGKFYRLVLRTRRRHGLPPQPITWFQNLMEYFGSDLTIRVAHKDAEPIATMLTLQHRRTLVYKYGASDERFHNLGGMPYLFWSAVQDAIGRGLEHLDLGRSDMDNPGLIAFKEHLGGQRSQLSYWRYPRRESRVAENGWKLWLVHRACGFIPDSLLATAGTLVYRHIA